jgi:serine/threonine protein kinase
MAVVSERAITPREGGRVALSVGTRLGPYEILEPLGAGGMGEVYRALDPKLNREVALKVLPPELASEPERLERFGREARTLAALSHPHIVTVFSVEEAEGLHFLTMQLVEGKTLAKVIPRTGLPLSRFFRIAIPLAEAVNAAHEKGIAHRDLKPGNVMVTEDDEVQVLDFGLAKQRAVTEDAMDTQATTQEATEAGRVMGTAPYMSPEQLQGLPVTHHSDVFSLGIVLYEMATGHRPFDGRTSAELASSILKDTPPPVTELKAGLPRGLGRLIKHCLEKEPKKRFQSTLDRWPAGSCWPRPPWRWATSFPGESSRRQPWIPSAICSSYSRSRTSDHRRTRTSPPA